LLTSVGHKSADYKSDRARKGHLRGDMKTAAPKGAAVFLSGVTLNGVLTLFRLSDIISPILNAVGKPAAKKRG
jgi:hypothetical protein